MLICPQDLHLCRRPDCRAAGCERTGEPPLAECAECGAMFVRAFRHALRLEVCVDCISSSGAAAILRHAESTE
jgi:hypothetical protein